MMNLEKGEHRNGNTPKMCWVVVTENESAKDSKEIDHKEKEHNNVSDRSETLHNEKNDERYKVPDRISRLSTGKIYLDNANNYRAKLWHSFDEGEETDESKHAQRSNSPAVFIPDESVTCYHHHEVKRVETTLGEVEIGCWHWVTVNSRNLKGTFRLLGR
jgi:hypothetical protein